MDRQDAASETVTVAEAARRLRELVETVSHKSGRVIIEKDGAPVAALISAADLDRFTQWERWRAEQFKALEASWAAFADIPDEELEREVAKALTEVRAENRKQRNRRANVA
jgi:prevent-host-death family protein